MNFFKTCGNPVISLYIILLKLYKQLLGQIKEAKKEMKKKKKIFQFEELKSRKRILRRLEYATTSDVIEIKGILHYLFDSQV